MEKSYQLAQQIRGHTYKWNSNLYEEHFKTLQNEWDRLCAAMDVLEDTCLALQNYERDGLSSDEGEKYLRLYGLLQAICVQQDSIRHLYDIFTERPLKNTPNSAWEHLREVRHKTAGHPIETFRGKINCFLSRQSIQDDKFTIVIWETTEDDTAPTRLRSQEVALRELYEKYKTEATEHLRTTHAAEVLRWPSIDHP